MAGAGIKAINKRIRSVKSTQQITKAMKMVAAAKLRRAQSRLLAARPYAGKLVELLGHVAESGAGDHPLFARRPLRRALYVVITSDKGLAGAYNMNVIKTAQAAMRRDREAAAGAAGAAAGAHGARGAAAGNVEVAVYAIGKKARDFFGKRGYEMFASHADFGGEASAERARLVAKKVEAAFLDGTFDEVKLVYARFVSTLTQRPLETTLLPITPPESGATARGKGAKSHAVVDYIWEPSKEELYRSLLPLYVRNRVYIALCEAYASEHGARMTSMSAATENAGELIDYLTLRRNRERQAAITREINEIVGGANAL